MAEMLQIGEAGVLRVMSELILRGHCPYRPAFDDKGVDLMLSTGVRIQVKTARLHGRKHHARPAYHESTTAFFGGNNSTKEAAAVPASVGE